MTKYIVRSNSHDPVRYLCYDWGTPRWTLFELEAARFTDKMSAYRALRDMMNMAFDRNEEPADMSIIEVS